VNRATLAACALLLLAVATSTGEAHKGVTAKHTYNADVYPIFVTRCAHCHVAGGVGPMSLVSYEQAFPWAESLRAELLNLGEGEGNDWVRDAHNGLTANELDVVLDWAVGGTPEGDPAKRPAALPLKNGWAGASPDLVLQPPSLFAIPGETMEATHDFVLPVGLARERALRAFDVLPGTPSMVRDVVVSMRRPDGATNVIGRWTPRQIPAAIAVAPGTLLPPGADLIARVHYKKTWKYEGQALTDRSSLGLYFADK
jgi:hypothetical protein